MTSPPAGTFVGTAPTHARLHTSPASARSMGASRRCALGHAHGCARALQ